MSRTRLTESELRAASAASADVHLREFVSHRDRNECVELQQRIWGSDYRDVVPASMISAAQKAGGVAAGAFQQNGDMVGFIYGVPAVRDGRLIHWSHMLGVVKSHRQHGVGRRLKHFQRDCLLERGITEMRWTFDPLVAANAHFNLNVLRVRIDEYVVDMYGETGSDLHSFGTDRLVACWEFGSPQAHEPAGTDGVSWNAAPHWNDVERAAEGSVTALVLPAAIRISIPQDIFALSRRDPALGIRWRRETRAAFGSAGEQGYRIVGFSRPADSLQCHYLLRRGVIELT